MLALPRDASNDDGIFLGAKLVDEHFRERRRDGEGFSAVVEVAVGGLRPFQDDVGSVFLVESEESAVQMATFLFEHAHDNFDAGITKPFDAAPLHLGKRVDATHDDAAHTLSDDKVAAGRRFPVVRAGFERHVERGLGQQFFVVGAHRCKGVHLGVALATAHVVALAQNPPAGHDHTAHHRIRSRQVSSARRQLDAASHEFFVCQRL